MPESRRFPLRVARFLLLPLTAGEGRTLRRQGLEYFFSPDLPETESPCEGIAGRIPVTPLASVDQRGGRNSLEEHNRLGVAWLATGAWNKGDQRGVFGTCTQPR